MSCRLTRNNTALEKDDVGHALFISIEKIAVMPGVPTSTSSRVRYIHPVRDTYVRTTPVTAEPFLLPPSPPLFLTHGSQPVGQWGTSDPLPDRCAGRLKALPLFAVWVRTPHQPRKSCRRDETRLSTYVCKRVKFPKKHDAIRRTRRRLSIPTILFYYLLLPCCPAPADER